MCVGLISIDWSLAFTVGMWKIKQNLRKIIILLKKMVKYYIKGKLFNIKILIITQIVKNLKVFQKIFLRGFETSLYLKIIWSVRVNTAHMLKNFFKWDQKNSS